MNRDTEKTRPYTQHHQSAADTDIYFSRVLPTLSHSVGPSIGHTVGLVSLSSNSNSSNSSDSNNSNSSNNNSNSSSSSSDSSSNVISRIEVDQLLLRIWQ